MEDRSEQLFLKTAGAALRGGTMEPDQPVRMTELLQMFYLAERHLMLPMIYETVYNSESFSAAAESDPGRFSEIQKMASSQVVSQYKRTAAFLNVYQFLLEQGIRPLVVKGLVCRGTYPLPEHRQSWDEDLFIRPDDFAACHQALLRYGMEPVASETEMEADYEASYRDPSSDLIVEVHKELFSSDSQVFGELNRYFGDAFDRAVRVPASGESDHTVRVPVPEAGSGEFVWTMDPSMHFFYLICHLYKHFLHFGAGFRQVTDVLMFAASYRSQIDWNMVRQQCRELHTETFVAGLFAIGVRYLKFGPDVTGFPQEWLALAVDTEPLLCDIMEAGMQANTSLSRIHSSSITLDAVAAGKTGKKNSVWKLIFPPAGAMRRRYSYLERMPFLLPAAWGQRLISYFRETAEKDTESSVREALQIGNERIELFRQQGILQMEQFDRDLEYSNAGSVDRDGYVQGRNADGDSSHRRKIRKGMADEYPLLSVGVCLLLYFAATAFLNRYWGSILVRLGINGLFVRLGLGPVTGWLLAFTRQAALCVFLLCMVWAAGQWRIFRQERQPFYRGLITGGYMLFISLLSIVLSLIDAEGFNSKGTILFSTLYFILVGVNEELIFRGITADLLLRGISGKAGKSSGNAAGRRRTVILAAVLSSIFFSLAHLSNMQYADAFGVAVQMAGAFLMGMVLTVVYYRTRNIYSVMILHAVNDIAGAFAVTVLRSEESIAGVISSYGVGELLMLIPYVIVLIVILRKV